MFSRIVGHHPSPDSETTDFPMWKTPGKPKILPWRPDRLTGPLKRPGPGTRPDLARCRGNNLGYTSFPSGESGKTETAQPGRTTKTLAARPARAWLLRFVVLLSMVIEKKYQSSLTGSVRVKDRERLARERVHRRSVAIPRKSGQSYFLILEIAHAEMMNRNC